jgi:hypothetical protein
MRLLCTLALSAAYLTLAPILAVETARSYQIAAPDRHITLNNESIVYKSDASDWPIAVNADRG